MSHCGTFGTCGQRADCRDHHCPGREMGREREILQLQQEIADESARTDVECIAQAVPRYHKLMPVYRLDEVSSDLPSDEEMHAAYRQALDKAARYLSLRGLLVRPVEAYPQYVCFARAS